MGNRTMPPPQATRAQDGPVKDIARRVGRILAALQVISLVCCVFAGASMLSQMGPWSRAHTWLATLYGLIIVSVAVLWVLRARCASPRHRAVIAVLIVVAAPWTNLAGSIGFTTPLLLLVTALLVTDVSVLASLLGAVWVGAVGFGAHMVSGSSLMVASVNTFPIMVLMGFGVLLGAALRAHDAAHRRDELMIEERDAAVKRLESAMDRLHRSAELEKELVLADERARSARDLHDGLGHRLTLISMSLEFAQRMRRKNPDAAWDEVTTADETSREAMAEMRTWVRALSPVRDTAATGAAAFEAIAESFRGTGLDVVVDSADEGVELTENASLLLYRAVQEGLTNALRHGRAHRVHITRVIDAKHVKLRISNDFDRSVRDELPVGPACRGFGLRGLADRAENLGGDMSASRNEDRFVLLVRLPRHNAVANEPTATDRDGMKVTG